MTLQNDQNEIVSYDSEPLILVDENDNILGYRDKAGCHEGKGVLHRAFSLFIFNSEGNLLLQKRSSNKRLWPLYWSNSCCSHPRKNETTEVAVTRRLQQELGMKGKHKYLYKFQYHAKFDENGAEHELCSVFLGYSDDLVLVNHNEIADWRFIEPDQLTEEIAKNPDQFTPWLKLEWQHILMHHRNALKEFTSYQKAPKGL